MSIVHEDFRNSDRQADRALKRLAGAVLIQAVQDASNGPARVREEALDWFSGAPTAGLSFKLCCDLLDRSPEDVIRRLMKGHFIAKVYPTESARVLAHRSPISTGRTRVA